jgi:hypothetical protein
VEKVIRLVQRTKININRFRHLQHYYQQELQRCFKYGQICIPFYQLKKIHHQYRNSGHQLRNSASQYPNSASQWKKTGSQSGKFGSHWRKYASQFRKTGSQWRKLGSQWIKSILNNIITNNLSVWQVNLLRKHMHILITNNIQLSTLNF